MAYVAVDSDDRLEQGNEGLQFKSFLGADASAGGGGVGNTDRGYLSDQPQRKSSGGFWTIEHYSPYFDLDTKTVLSRCLGTLPFQSTDFFSTHLNPPDLYGPFWTLTTLIFTLFLSSSLAASITNYLGDPESQYDYNFGLLSVAVGIVYTYGLLLPVGVWGALRWMGVGEWSIVEAVAVWGYGLFVWVPVSVLCVIPVRLVRWVLVLIAFGSSGWFLVKNVYPILASAEKKAMRLVIIFIAVLHAGLAITFQVVFFSYYVIPPPDDKLALPGMGMGATSTMEATMTTSLMTTASTTLAATATEIAQRMYS